MKSHFYRGLCTARNSFVIVRLTNFQRNALTRGSQRQNLSYEKALLDIFSSGVPGGVWGVQTPPEVLDCMSKKDRRLDFLLQFTVFSYGCNLLNKVSF